MSETTEDNQVSCIGKVSSGSILKIVHKNKQNNLLTLFSQNMQGFSSKSLEIELFLEKFKYDIVCVTEHWLKGYQVESINFKNYCVGNYFSRQQKPGIV